MTPGVAGLALAAALLGAPDELVQAAPPPFSDGIFPCSQCHGGEADAVFTRYLWSGVGEHRALVPFTWLGLGCSLVAFVILLVPRTRRSFPTLNVGCVLVWIGVYVEKGMGLVVAGMTPDVLGEIYEYTPSWTELLVAAGIFAIGSLVFLGLVRIAVAILHGDLRAPGALRAPATAAGAAVAASEVPVAAVAPIVTAPRRTYRASAPHPPVFTESNNSSRMDTP